MSIQATENGILINNKLYYVKITQNKQVTVIKNTTGNAYQNAQIINSLVASLFNAVIAKNTSENIDPRALSLKINYDNKNKKITKVTANQLGDEDLKGLKLQKIGMFSGLGEINNVEAVALKIIHTHYQSISSIPKNISSNDLILDEKENIEKIEIVEKEKIEIFENNNKTIKKTKKTEYEIIYESDNKTVPDEHINEEIVENQLNENTNEISTSKKITEFFKNQFENISNIFKNIADTLKKIPNIFKKNHNSNALQDTFLEAENNYENNPLILTDDD